MDSVSTRSTRALMHIKRGPMRLRIPLQGHATSPPLIWVNLHDGRRGTMKLYPVTQ
jgi:hypothetical protein